MIQTECRRAARALAIGALLLLFALVRAVIG